MILIDTSAWVDFFLGKHSNTGKHIKTELESGAPALCGPIWMELIRGVRKTKKSKDIFSLLQSCHFLEQPDHLWEEAGELGRYLGQKGFAPGSLDLLIAIYAMAHKVPLLTLDQDFQHMVKVGISLDLVKI